MTDEAPLVASGDGLEPDGAGWFVVNLRQARWREHERFGRWASFEGGARFGDFGLNVHILEPDQPACRVHSESVQEGFLVLHGAAKVVVAGEERPLEQWDYFHCPPGTDHVLVGAGEGPCAVLMVGARRPDATVHYPVDAAAARYGASVDVATDDPRQAYRDTGVSRDVPSPWPLG